MINFIIYEDNDNMVSQLKQAIDVVMFQNDVSYSVNCFKEEKDIMEYIVRPSLNKIYILDMEYNALSIARTIRDNNLNDMIIFYTDFMEKYCMEILRANFFLYSIINHNNATEIISNAVSYLLKNCTISKPYVLEMKSQNVIFRIPVPDILCIYNEKTSRHVSIVTSFGTFSVVGTLSKVKNKLNENFVYSHRSCLVNISRIMIIDKKARKIVFDNGMETDLLSFREMKSLQQKL